MAPSVTVVDYGMGNLLSVTRALEHCGATPHLTADPDVVARADHLVLPGVGAFADAMDNLKARGLHDAARTHAASGRPFLGICLGMQLLLSESNEFGCHDGLNVIPGTVAAIPITTADGAPHKVPHIGWAPVEPAPGTEWRSTVFADIEPGTAFYFVHSYAAHPNDPVARLATADYGGHPITAAIRHGNVYATQFHPEKSGPAGLQVIAGFLRLG